jgi:phosphoglycerate dehydrogenase-like enzyme
MTAQPPKPARVWLPPGSPAALADAIRRGGGDVVDVADANVLFPYGYAAVSADQEPFLRSLLTDEVEWVQLQPAGVEDWFTLGLVDDRRLWTSSAGAYAVAVAEHVLALLLAAAKRLADCARATTWRRGELQGVPLSGSTVGIVGAGGIGREIIKRLEPFDVRVIASTHSGAEVPGAARSLRADELDELLTESDYVVLCAPLTPETEGLIGAHELDLLGPAGSLVNVARGAIVDTDALVAALREGRLGGALLDVTEPEPLPDGHPLWSEPRALITPHVANTRAQLEAALARRVEQNVARFRAGEPLLGVVDPAAGY